MKRSVLNFGIFLLLLVVVIGGITSCSEKSKSEKLDEIIDDHTSENALDWIGSYYGLMPCADCPGIETTLTLSGDKKYKLKTKYQEKAEKVFIETGSFSWNEAGSEITLFIDKKTSVDHQYKVVENGLVKLDNRGGEITGNLKEMYRLEKSEDQMIKLNSGEYIYNVSSSKVPCEGAVKQHCFKIQKGNEYNPDSLELFYSNIEGFDFMAGYHYKLVVKEEQLDTSNVPADASSINYTLVRILSQKLDERFRLHDIWALETIEGVKIQREDYMRHPDLEINITENRVMGNDGCNTFSGELLVVSNKRISIGTLATTKMACENMEASAQIMEDLSNVVSYKLDGLKLKFFDAKGKELLKYRKVD